MTLSDELQRNIEESLAKMKACGIEWSAERQKTYNAACRQFYRASIANNEPAKNAALVIVRRMEAEGGLL